MASPGEQTVSIPSGIVSLEAVFELPKGALGVVVFSHGSGSGRHSPRNRFVAAKLRGAGLGTLLLDLLTPQEDSAYAMRFDIDLLTARLGDAVKFLRGDERMRGLPVGLFGASTGAASALRVAALMPGEVAAVVSRGGRPDLAEEQLLAAVRAPTLLIVGGFDHSVIELNEAARVALLHCQRELAIVPGATHLFEEPGTLDEVARLAAAWFVRYLRPSVESNGSRQ